MQNKGGGLVNILGRIGPYTGNTNNKSGGVFPYGKRCGAACHRGKSPDRRLFRQRPFYCKEDAFNAEGVDRGAGRVAEAQRVETAV